MPTATQVLKVKHLRIATLATLLATIFVSQANANLSTELQGAFDGFCPTEDQAPQPKSLKPVHQIGQEILTVVTDRLPGTIFSLRLQLGRGGCIQKIHYFEGKVLLLTFTPKEAQKGVVMMRQTGVKVMELKVPASFDPVTGGEVDVVLMRKFILFDTDYRIYRMQITRQGDGPWTLTTNGKAGRSPFNHLYLETLRKVDADPTGLTPGTGKGDAVGIKLLSTYLKPDQSNPVELLNTDDLKDNE